MFHTIEGFLRRICGNRIAVMVILLIVNIILPANKAFSQCAPEVFSRECLEHLPEGFTYLKSYNVDGQQQSGDIIEYTSVLSKETHYSFQICTPAIGADGIVLSIFDSNRNKLSSNAEGSNIDTQLIFKCQSTGIYYLVFSFSGSTDYCGGCVMSFKK